MEEPTLETLIHKIQAIEKETKGANSKIEVLTRESTMLHFHALHLAQVEYYKTYGEYDVDVRLEYMRLIISLSYTWPHDNEAIGYPVSLRNVSSTNKPIDPNENIRDRLDGLTKFVKAENIDKCKITPRIRDAFLLLKYHPALKELGFFAIHANPIAWKDFDDFDSEGYKSHLIGFAPDGF